MKYVISGPSGPVQDTIYIPSSKSISNRLLIMMALEGKDARPDSLSDSDDTVTLREMLYSRSLTRDVGHAGTAMRFLTAYFATGDRKLVLTGSERMKERPIGPLVDALRELGAGIRYLGNEGYPPLEISGGLKRGGRITVDGSISSQFISALMMIGPCLTGGLHITLEGKIVSSTYIEMTLALMKKGGIQARFSGREIRVEEGCYKFGKITVESDWSGASYWYEAAALFPGSTITLPGLEMNSLQGDAILPELFRHMGVRTLPGDGAVILQSGAETGPGPFHHDFTGCPDLVQTCTVSLCALGIPFRITGTRTLKVKETDRISALQKELGKLGFILEAGRSGEWIGWNGARTETRQDPVIETYHDHRMAMAFAPLSAKLGSIIIEDPMVVSKSYPEFWAHLEHAGFAVEPLQET